MHSKAEKKTLMLIHNGSAKNLCGAYEEYQSNTYSVVTLTEQRLWQLAYTHADEDLT